MLNHPAATRPESSHTHPQVTQPWWTKIYSGVTVTFPSLPAPSTLHGFRRVIPAVFRASDSLQAVFLFDEADLYLPAAGAVPATKGPMESLLKRARSAGLGLFLATQSPGDLDYRCRDQVLTWLVGRVKEPVAIAKLRPMLDRRPEAADKRAGQKAGEFYLVREGDVTAVSTTRNLIPTEQVLEDRILTLARDGSSTA